ncbi:hypothetical protein LTR10_022301 [Elasticomyces elasticus]|uniref:ABM domain-containing protein n=1 Tax=Exophiala sideris TaxID=1016849 RepID=A0ABR0J674_9EURO|nr:hypothetical protein LTR10_022301 [Elasticomyces elasticus]KAK5028789.1 hypothetical protein LTS07_006168 [Exophiala sideris]KAK5035658.1 hypothetical protein LTR13_005787 [Exophiala sideris]KAK5057293.1 hypothetical protein LTR69_007332 [Exophiala sideris]KAK5181734.1 hypothetical protein LTR44_005934 [Eurotiomycetes sp. CCFEE 6388]
MARIVTVGHLITSSNDARNRVIKALEQIAEYSGVNEPGVLTYAITVPRDDDGTTIYVLEEYADKATSDAHLASHPVQTLISLFTLQSVLKEAPTVYQLEPVYSFTKPEVMRATDPYIMFANISYKAGGATQSFPYWKAVSSTSENNEPGSLLYRLCREEGNADRLHTVEVYESKEYLWDIHAKSEQVRESVTKTKDLRSGLVHAPLKMVGGFLHR